MVVLNVCGSGTTLALSRTMCPEGGEVEYGNVITMFGERVEPSGTVIVRRYVTYSPIVTW
jgi:hypothetical protein